MTDILQDLRDDWLEAAEQRDLQAEVEAAKAAIMKAVRDVTIQGKRGARPIDNRFEDELRQLRDIADELGE